MNKKIFLTMAVMLSCMTAFAQSLEEGFYRVQNFGSGYYLYIKDCTGDISTLGADMDACELWSGLDNAVSDPGSVMYFKKAGNAYDITSQATGVYEITGRYMTMSKVDDGYQVYSTGQYLYDIGKDDFSDKHLIGAKTSKDMPGKGDYSVWKVPAVSSSSDNYFGFKPTVTADGKYYAPFYAAFGYTPLNGQKTWYVSSVDKTYGIAVVKEITGTVAPQQAVLVECASSSTASNKVDLVNEGGNAASGNLLKGLFFTNGDRNSKTPRKNPAVVEFDPTTMRVLGTNAEGKLSFVNSSSSILTVDVADPQTWKYSTKQCLPHNTSYLTVDADCPATLTVMTESEYDTYIKTVGISSVKSTSNSNNIYDLNGRLLKTTDVSSLPHGVYIMNGKKISK